MTLLFPSMIIIEIVLFLGTEPRQPINTRAQAHPTQADPAVATAAHQEQPVTNAVDAWADSVLGGLEDHPPCQHCFNGVPVSLSVR